MIAVIEFYTDFIRFYFLFRIIYCKYIIFCKIGIDDIMILNFKLIALLFIEYSVVFEQNIGIGKQFILIIIIC